VRRPLVAIRLTILGQTAHRIDIAGILMKILLVTEFFPPHVGGVEVEFREFSRCLVQNGDSVTVVTSAHGSVPGHEVMSGVHVYRYPWKAILGKPVGRKADIEKHIDGIDLAMTSTFSTALSTLAVARAHGVPCILSVQELAHERYRTLVWNRFLAGLLRWYEKRVVTAPFSSWHAISESTKRDAIIVGAPAAKVHAIPLGIDETEWNAEIQPVDLAAFFGYEPQTRVFLFFGRAGITKGLDVLIESIRVVASSLPHDVRFGFILANHPKGARERTQEKLARLGLCGIVRIRPSVGRCVLPRHVKGAECVIIPSRWEGFGFSAAETCRLGVPVIASDAGSLPEVVSGKHLFFRSADREDLGAKILRAARGDFEEKPYRALTWPRATSELRQLFEHTVRSHAGNSEVV
jgi:D-inositol-3-phosphate glycosyltransferase